MTTAIGAATVAAWAVAAQRLEGWEPDDEEIAALSSLAGGAISVGDYLAGCRRRYVDDVPRRTPVLARRRPYLIRGTDVLDNNLDISSMQVLARAEHAVVAGRTVRLLTQPVAVRSVGDVHRALFADVYSWAGEPRTIDISKRGTRFAAVHEIAAGMARTDRDVTEALACADGYSPTALGHRLARIYADYNAIHPFREGNGRAGTMLLQLIAMRGGRWLALDRLTGGEWLAASRASIAGTTVVGPDAEPLRALLEPLIVG
ncbi:hypothetical protein GOARA_064_01860 [Gordonia araii NBRC 100433]|uniref:protein adenylyltransferase n=1 Tax=Gordonia araii NBRC 100433 TaxID=1073574 RepID=G7H5Q9_9ACTN|nr:Fic family protein [Gordonia araii]NNG95896.1 cell filamentation protein Fic [Gordonia araii NBRC 100433]GAB11184.1 hypothetical protein GOARA_064_01860 [Gordonia araii NBRC 100433]